MKREALTLEQQEKLLKFVEQSNVEIGGRSGFIFNTKHGHPFSTDRSGAKNIQMRRLQ